MNQVHPLPLFGLGTAAWHDWACLEGFHVYRNGCCIYCMKEKE